MKVFSTITSPVFSELVIIIGASEMAYLPSEFPLFETLRKMNKRRPFELVFLLVGSDLFLKEGRQKLEGALDSVATRGLLDLIDSPPTIRSAGFPEHGWDMPFG
jgi:hypothetical protein